MRKMVFVPYCMLNVNAKVEGIAATSAGMPEIVFELMNSGYGIIQLPCPEMERGGLRRWGQVEEQLDNPYYREHCRKRLHPYVMQAKAFSEQGYELAGVIGFDGSPTCAVSQTCSGPWGGEMGKPFGTQEKIESLKAKEGPGIMMGVFKEMLETEGIRIPFIGIQEDGSSIDCDSLLDALEEAQR